MISSSYIQATEHSMGNCGMKILTRPMWTELGYSQLNKFKDTDTLAKFRDDALDEFANKLQNSGVCWVMSDGAMQADALGVEHYLAKEVRIRRIIPFLSKYGSIWCSPIAINPAHVVQGYHDYNQCFIYYPPNAKMYDSGKEGDMMAACKMVGLSHITSNRKTAHVNVISVTEGLPISEPEPELGIPNNIKPRVRRKKAS